MAIFYSAARFVCKLVRICCIRPTIVHADRFDLPGGFIIACTHLSHLEPLLLSLLVCRQIDWMARIEFYKYHIFAKMLDWLDAFPVNRQGIPVRAIRTAIHRAGQGKIVGIFPEGGVAHGAHAAIRGGPIKAGACTVAYRARLPIVPVVILGTDKLNRIAPWLPFGRAKIWIIFGNPIHPPLDQPRRLARKQMAGELLGSYQSLYEELCTTCNISDKDVA